MSNNEKVYTRADVKSMITKTLETADEAAMEACEAVYIFCFRSACTEDLVPGWATDINAKEAGMIGYRAFTESLDNALLDIEPDDDK